MSIESLNSRAGTELEHALARICSRIRDEWAERQNALDAERRAALAELAVVRLQLQAAQNEYLRWLNEIKAQRIEMRGEPGAQGDKGEKGDQGLEGTPGLPGDNGRDGRDGLPGAPGAAGRDGNDGRDGLGVADLDVVYDGERMLTLRWANGDRLVERQFVMPLMIYRGSWHAGIYERGDVVSYAGALFIAKLRTAIKPETDDWQLCVKRGLPGKNGERGPPGPAGRDLMEM